MQFVQPIWNWSKFYKLSQVLFQFITFHPIPMAGFWGCRLALHLLSHFSQLPPPGNCSFLLPFLRRFAIAFFGFGSLCRGRCRQEAPLSEQCNFQAKQVPFYRFLQTFGLQLVHFFDPDWKAVLCKFFRLFCVFSRKNDSRKN